jgi:putative Mn2+ efflux pump MntP
MDIPGLDAVMNISATILLAFGMSMDAFAASIGKGATLHKPKFSEALRTGLIFGAIETLTPLIGWGLGMLASQFVLEWNHWIAFVLLVFLGGRMVIEGFRGNMMKMRSRSTATVSGCWSPPPLPPALTRWPSASVWHSCRSILSPPRWRSAAPR